MQEIKGYDRTIQVLLSGGSYGIDYYQREYKWQTKQLLELVNDLAGRFLEDYHEGHASNDVKKYGHYFLGSIVISKQGEKRQIVDGQQRITTLTLLLIYLNNAQKGNGKEVDINALIYADDFGEKKFKLSVEERNDCMEALFNDQPYDADGKSESVQNLVARYNDIEEIFPSELKAEALPPFIYWLKEKVILIEITAYEDADAYTIFETMNDRGLSLTPTDMLKGYLLANIENPEKRIHANKLIKAQLLKFAEFDKDTESDFFKAWLRAHYAQKIRERKKDAKPEDFDLIGTEYHRWVRNNKHVIGLDSAESFYSWVSNDFTFYAELFIKVLEATQTRTKGLESIRYNADLGFTMQLQLLLAAATPKDGSPHALEKVAVVADFIDCWLNRRLWNFRSIDYSTMQYAVFLLTKEVRGKTLEELRSLLHNRLIEEEKEVPFEGNLFLNKGNAKSLQRQLARLTDWLEQQCNLPGKYEDYLVRSGKNAYEIEHIWSKHYEPHAAEFEHPEDFERFRNMIGGLVLLPKKVNGSLNDADYEYKLQHYIKENILAQTLHPLCYENNPGMRQLIDRYRLAFKPHDSFNKEDLEMRSQLYKDLAKVIWSADRLMPSAKSEAA